MRDRTLHLAGSALLCAVALGCGGEHVEPLGGRWRIVWKTSPLPESGGTHSYLYRGRVKVEENTSRYRSIGSDCVLFVAGNHDRGGLYAACGDREPILLSPGMDDRTRGYAGATGLGNERVPLSGGVTMSVAEAIRRASAQPPFHEGWAYAPDRRGSLDAAVQGRSEDIDAVLARGGDPNARDRDGNAPLHWAAYFGNLSTTEALLRRGARADVSNLEGSTALHFARGNGEVVTLLVRSGAPLNARNAQGATALFLAVERDDVELAGRLLDSGADPTIADRSGRAPIDLAGDAAVPGRETRHGEIVTLLLRKLPDSPRDDLVRRRTASAATERLSYLAGRPATIGELTRLLDEGADVNFSGFRGETPLMSAAKNHETDQVRLFLDRSADPNLRDEQGTTALMDAAHAGDLESIRLLLKHGADISAKTNEGHTALYWAEFMDHPDCAAVLRAASGSARELPTAGPHASLRRLRSLLLTDSSTAASGGRPPNSVSQ